jgi:hypothetical protein
MSTSKFASSDKAHEAEESSAAAGANKGDGATREQLLDFIRRQKLKLKKLENENSALETKLATSLTVNSSQQNVGGGVDDGLFWELIARQPEFQQRIAKAALRSMLGPFLHRTSVKSCFSDWKTATREAKMAELEAKLEESTKNAIELEKRCLKLKGLLSRTHQANKQQAEDTNAFKRAQREATQELRTHAQEKLALLEEVRARDIESAFQQDLEIYIQKVVESQHLQLQQQIQTQSQGGNANKVLLKEVEDENAKLLLAIQELQTREAELSIKLKESKQFSNKTEKLAATHSEKARDLEKRLQELERELQDEKCSRRDLEVELDITLKTRSDILHELESSSESKVSKIMEDSSAQLRSAQAQCEALEKKLSITLSALTSSTDENAKLRRAAQIADNSDELARVRARLLEYKRLVKSGTLVNITGGEETWTRLFELASKFATQARKYSDGMYQAQQNLRGLQRFVVKTHEGILQCVGNKISPFISEGQALDFPGVDRAHLSSAHSSRKRLEEARAELEVKLKSLAVGTSEPMVWEASSVTIQAGKDITFAIPMPTRAKSKLDALLEWTYSGPQAGFVSLTLGKALGKPSDALSLQSVQGHGDKSSQFKGSHRLSSADGDRVLKLSASSVWGPVNVSYFIRLAFQEADNSVLERASATKELTALGVKLAQVSRQIDAAEGAINRLRRMASKASALADIAQDEPVSSSLLLSELDTDLRKLTELRSLMLKSFRQDGNIQGYDIGTPRATGRGNARDAPSGGIGTDAVSASSQHDSRSFVPSSSPVSVLNCESLKIRASDDFRVYVPPSLVSRPFKLQWTFELIGGSRKMDVGFAVLSRQEDGALPTLIPYKRIKSESSGELIVSGEGDSTIVVLFDNTFSWARTKELKCSIQVVHGDIEDSAGEGVGRSELSSQLETTPSNRKLDSVFPTPRVEDILKGDDMVKIVSDVVDLWSNTD